MDRLATAIVYVPIAVSLVALLGMVYNLFVQGVEYDIPGVLGYLGLFVLFPAPFTWFLKRAANREVASLQRMWNSRAKGLKNT